MQNKETIVTPENALLELPVVSLKQRFKAFSTDVMILTIFTGALHLLATISSHNFNKSAHYIILTIVTLGSFLLWNGYFIFFELARGSTPGKLIYEHRVICQQGTALSTGAVYIRNLMREIEIWLPLRLCISMWQFTVDYGELVQIASLGWVVIFSIIPFVDKKSRRLGDLLAGTVVVAVPRTRLPIELAKHKPEYHFSSQEMKYMGTQELFCLEDILRRFQEIVPERRYEFLYEVALKIHDKIDFSQQISKKDSLLFLQDFYQALRRELEEKMIVGETSK